MKMVNVGIIGAGLIGNKRAAALEGAELIQVADVNEESAKKLASEYNCKYTTDWKEVVSNPEIDIVFVCTTHDLLTPISVEALQNGKHVLVEKPAGRNPDEVAQLVKAAQESGKKVKVGFNHRYHPAMLKAKELLDSGAIGEFCYIRAVYGHGGRPGYEKEWRANPEKSGGGEMLDQGSHLIDLSRWYAGNFDDAVGFATNEFWEIPVEDNGFAILRSKEGKTAFLHASWTEWKNRFYFHIFGKTGVIEINGLGRSYGPETLTLYKMKPEMGPPDQEVFEFPEADNSWALEFKELLAAIEENREPLANANDALESIKLVHKLYNWSKAHSEAK
ncbi:MAG: Gfo/Idh/MocA family oxidoreductase [archaeon]